jgi:uncharacterized protein YecT (DUF1311 family)
VGEYLVRGKIFISYRRGDDPGSAGRLLDALKAAFDVDQLFIDVDNIEPGLDFVEVIQERIAQSQILLAVISKHWSEARETDGTRRLDNPSDPVRVEIESALDQNKRVIPVLFGDTKMPAAESLPESLRALSRRNAVQIRHERFADDAAHLTAALKNVLRSSAARQTEAAEQETWSKSAAPSASFGSLVQKWTPARFAMSILTAVLVMGLAVVYLAGSFFGPMVHPGPTLQSATLPKYVPGPSTQPRWCLEKTLKPDELRICASQSLWMLDKQLNELFNTALASTAVDKRDALMKEESQWVLGTRGGCIQDENCIAASIMERIAYLTKLNNS